MSINFEGGRNHEGAVEARPLLDGSDEVVDGLHDNGDDFKIGVAPLLDGTAVTPLDEVPKIGTIGSSIFNLAGTIMGASSLAMGHAAKNTGLILFPILLVGVGLVADWSVRILARMMRMTGGDKYAAVGKTAFSRSGEVAAHLCVIIQQLGACIAYVKIVGDILTPIVHRIETPFFNQVAVWQVIVGVTIIFPLTMLRHITSLRYSSFAALTLIMIFNVTIVIDGLHQVGNDAVNWADRALIGSASDIISAVPVICFAFVCHMNVFPIVAELKDPSPARVNIVSKGSVGGCFVVYALVGILAYAMFGDTTAPDIIESYQDAVGGYVFVPAGIILGLQGCMGFALVFTYPILAFELRHSADSMLFGHKEFSWMRHTGVNVAVVSISLLVAILVPSVTVVFGFTGATTSCFVVFILPAFFFIRLLKLNPKHRANTSKTDFLMAWFQLVLGVVLVPVCLVVVSMKV